MRYLATGMSSALGVVQECSDYTLTTTTNDVTAVTGQVVLTCANGDRLSLAFHGTLSGSVKRLPVYMTGTLQVVEGTGRLQGVTGSGRGSFMVTSAGHCSGRADLTLSIPGEK